MKIFFAAILLLTSQVVIGQNNNQSELSLYDIMSGENYVGYLPEDIRWSEDSKQIYFSWNPDMDTLRSTYQADASTKKTSKLSIDQLKSLSGYGTSSYDGKMKVYEKNGDLYLMDLSNYSTKQITNTLARESRPGFSSDDQNIIFKQGDNLFTWNLATGSLTQLTDIKSGKKKSKPAKNEWSQWLEADQLGEFDILTKRKNEKDASKYRKEQVKANRPKTIYTGTKKLSTVSISPDLNFVVYRLVNSAKTKRTIVPDFVTQSGATTDLKSRPKVGRKADTYETWVLDIKGDTTYQVSTSDIEGIYDKPIYKKEYTKDQATYSDKYDKAREVFVSAPIFSQTGKAVVNITAHDYKDRWIMRLELSSGKLALIDHQHDDAWIAGPGIGWFSYPEMEWIDNDKIWFKSEKTGYSHLYTADVNSGKVKALTKGAFEVLKVQLSNDKQTFYLTTNEVSPHEQHFYHLPVKGGKRTQITSTKGGHEVTISPDEKQLAIRYSYSNKPWELYTMPNEPGASMTQITKSTTKAFDSYNWVDAEIVNITAKDGSKVPATLYKPTAEKNNGAAVIFVHGAGYLQNVHNWWSSYYREYMFHNMLIDNGYTVLAIDFRASAGYGRDWRTAIYRHMGGKDLSDQIDGADYLIQQQGVDKDRIGIYGGSYGGFITMMAMFNSPETFKSGAALRSVTDWAHYNHGYTANILNTPVEDSLAYRRSSPIYFADGLKGNLLILHGMVDTNVQFQDVVRLSQRLIELQKENWELAVFPMEGHGFKESSSWADEYRRIFKLFQDTLRK